MSKTLYISNFIGTFRRELNYPEMTIPDLAYVLCSMGCNKTADHRYYMDEVFAKLYGRTNEFRRRYESLYPMKYGITVDKDTRGTIADKDADIVLTRPDKNAVDTANISDEPDETNMEYVSYQLLKDDGVFYESVKSKPKTVRFIRRRCK